MRHNYGFLGPIVLLGSISFPAFVYAGLNEAFHVKPGTDKGGCDGIAGDLSGIFDEASTIIDSAVAGINLYQTDPTIRKLALAFFNVQMNDALTNTKDQKNSDLLLKIQLGMQILQDYAKGAPDDTVKPWIFCNSDWLQPVSALDDFLLEDPSGNLQSTYLTNNPTAGEPIVAIPVPGSPEAALQHASVLDVYKSKKMIQGLEKPYFSPDLKRYAFKEGSVDSVIKACDNPKELATSTALSSNGPQIRSGLTLCGGTGNGFFGRHNDRLDTSSADPTTYLDNIQPKSMTLIHEMLHLLPSGATSGDLPRYAPPATLLPTDPTWPGNPADFVVVSGPQADSVTDILLLALASGVDAHKIDLSNHPQSFAWLAVAIHLARNGAKMDYSTGQARALDAPIDKPAGVPPPTKSRRSLLKVKRSSE